MELQRKLINLTVEYVNGSSDRDITSQLPPLDKVQLGGGWSPSKKVQENWVGQQQEVQVAVP